MNVDIVFHFSINDINTQTKLGGNLLIAGLLDCVIPFSSPLIQAPAQVALVSRLPDN